MAAMTMMRKRKETRRNQRIYEIFQVKVTEVLNQKQLNSLAETEVGENIFILNRE